MKDPLKKHKSHKKLSTLNSQLSTYHYLCSRYAETCAHHSSHSGSVHAVTNRQHLASRRGVSQSAHRTEQGDAPQRHSLRAVDGRYGTQRIQV